jgi:hypothetical protein
MEDEMMTLGGLTKFTGLFVPNVVEIFLDCCWNDC